MRLALHRDDIKYGNIVGQQLIKAEKQIVIPLAFYIYMEKELTGMHLRIGTAAAGNVHGRFKDLAQGLLPKPAARLIRRGVFAIRCS
jgi:hypothetical protein